MKCGQCKKEFEEQNIHLHHIHPRFMDNKNGGGMKVNLCEKCHNKLHLIIPTILWGLLDNEKKKVAIKSIKNLSLKYGGLIK